MTQLVSPDSWQYRSLNAITPGLDALSDALTELVEDGYPVVAGSADLQYSNGLNRFADAYPERYIQFGISEQNMVSAAAGLATTGQMPFVATFASFLAAKRQHDPEERFQSDWYRHYRGLFRDAAPATATA